MNNFAALISTLFASRNQAHVFHFQTNSYSVHKALNGYYDEIIDLTDDLVESYQGKYGLVSNFVPAGPYIENASTEMILSYFTNLSSLVEEVRQQVPQDTYIQNQIDSIVELINGTVYKLRFLH